jgi:hypothetical protein
MVLLASDVTCNVCAMLYTLPGSCLPEESLQFVCHCIAVRQPSPHCWLLPGCLKVLYSAEEYQTSRLWTASLPGTRLNGRRKPIRKVPMPLTLRSRKLVKTCTRPHKTNGFYRRRSRYAQRVQVTSNLARRQRRNLTRSSIGLDWEMRYFDKPFIGRNSNAGSLTLGHARCGTWTF